MAKLRVAALNRLRLADVRPFRTDQKTLMNDTTTLLLMAKSQPEANS
jgi:hypothetical protein